LSVQTLNPLNDPRWHELIARHPLATVFHDDRWLAALRTTYGYEPVVITTSSPDETLENGWVFCHVDSWISGRRFVSLPFSDHCDPLTNDPAELEEFATYLKQRRQEQKWRYVEVRPRTVAFPTQTFQRSTSYFLQQVSLAPSSEHLFAQLHHDSIQRKVRRAEREHISVEHDDSGALLHEFYILQSMTRQRHRLPPQPPRWFRNLALCFGSDCSIWLARLRRLPIAAILTLRCGQRLVYKYGASDARFHALGAMPFLFWKVIEDAKALDLEELDLGRCDLGNTGLIKFKKRLGAVGHEIHYYREGSLRARAMRWMLPKWASSWMPAWISNAAGKALYRHVG
jgi:CelD/BcsL family acetyltransferase involved in cellulose biosynthesis